MGTLFMGVLVLSFSLSVIGQEKEFYIQEDEEFVLLMDSSTTVEKKAVDGGYVRAFAVGGSNNFRFVVSIGRAENPEWKNRSLSTKDFVKRFENDCACEVLSQKEKEYNNFTSVQFALRIVKNGEPLNALADNYLIGSTLFTIFYLSNPENFELYQVEYEEMINSFVINRSLF